MIPALPLSLYVKSLCVASPLEGIAKRVQRISSLRWRIQHPEFAEIFLEDARTETALKRLLKPDSCCVDVGCHIGSFLSLLTRLSPDGRHTAIEASPQKAARLHAKFPTADIRCVAVGQARGVAVFHEDAKRPGFSRLHKSTGHSSSYEVELQTLDDILATKPRVDLIKMDIEGGEFDGLLGAQDTIKKHNPAVIFECGSEASLQEIAASRKDLFDLIVETMGYEIFTFPDFLYNKGALNFDEFRKCGIYPFRAFNFLALRGSPRKKMVGGVPEEVNTDPVQF